MGLEDARKWFLPPGGKTGVGPRHENVPVEAFVDAEEYYAALRKDIEAATNSPSASNCWLFWIGFECSADTRMPASAPAPGAPKKYLREKQTSDVELLELLRKADDKGVNLRALLTLHPKPDTKPAKDRYLKHNFTLCQTINQQFKHAFAINDFRYLYMNGVHHQKLFLVYDGDTLTAYCGGLDLERARIDDSWCDFHCRFIGPPADHLFSIFEARWREHFMVKTPKIGFDARNEKLPNPRVSSRGGSLVCQITTTYGNPKRANPFGSFPVGQPVEQNVNLPHRLDILPPSPSPLSAFTSIKFTLPLVLFRVSNQFFATKNPAGVDILLHEQNQPRAYEFAPAGHHAIYDAVKLAISLSKRFIYIEDQYLVCDQAMGTLASVLELLKKKVVEPDFKRLVILTTRIDEINDDFQGTGWEHRSAFLRELHAAGPDKVAICQYKSNKQLGRGDSPLSPFYVHSKTWIFDDKLLLSGSANCNRRGYSHDSELDFALYDLEEAWVRETRARIWMRRLNTEGCFKPPSMAELKDVDNATVWDRWFRPYRYTKDLESSAYTQDQGGERRGTPGDFAPVAFPDLTASQMEKHVNEFLGQFGIEVAVAQTFRQFLWDNVVDPEGT